MFIVDPYRFVSAQEEFIILVKTDNPGTSASDQFTITTSGTGYNYDVDWGDGNTDTGVTGAITHTFAGGAGTYTVKISGDFRAIYFGVGTADKLKLLEIQNWGAIAWNVPANILGAFQSAFLGCSNLELTATDSPDLSAVTTMYYMFRQCSSMVGNASMNNWNTSNVSDFLGCFSFASNFNSPIGNWDMSSATNLRSMFVSASNFNQDIGSWNVQNVTTMESMFRNASAFNNGGSSSIGNWNTSNVTSFANIFNGVSAFNQDIGNWDFSNTSGSQVSIFLNASSFNQYLGNWQLNTGLTSLNQMFRSTAMSTANYTDTVVAWANQVFTNSGPFNVDFGTQSGRTFDRLRNGGANFSTAGDARNYLTSTAGWTISSDTVIPEEFVILVKTDNAGTSASDQFTIPTGPFVGSYNYDVDWGDGNTDTGVTTSITHTFSGGAGTYIVKISGTFPKIYFNSGGDRLKLLEVQNWGTILWQRMDSSFSGCQNMTITATDVPDFSALTNGTFTAIFANCDALIGGNLSNWDTSGFTTLAGAFDNTSLFNADLSNWDVSNVTSFSQIFRLALSFNNGGASGIDNWNVSSATTFSRMFQQSVFNQDISSWNTTTCTTMQYMFFGNTAFNQDISSWDVSNVVSFNNMFSGASSFNQNLGAWNISSLSNAQQIFSNSGMSTANYTDTIVSWANYVFVNGGPLNTNMSTQTGMTFDTSRSGGANFATAGDARTYLTTATPTGAGWTISGDTVI